LGLATKGHGKTNALYNCAKDTYIKQRTFFPSKVLRVTQMIDSQDRPMGQALRRGWNRSCPSCGKGSLLYAYLKVRPSCENCGQDFTPQRADDGPAYLTILIVGHLMAPMLMFVFVKFRPEPLTLATMFTIGTVALSLFLLPRLKGVMIAIQWAKRMHGFGLAQFQR
jgi:uncharacterized protein (DUF983 family)